ncbi:MAG: hypothetical protein EU981_04105 [Candidatus Liberibacter ctenarytainae]|uniref:Uncharacterized protein n=1 Tax=Candidatus Liberibacter ctenarytainae TaxID=2020335 RepID=A0A937ACJ3_9HYPH|nr:hypothetical protein [Candidatus Liberibacter ctenarytainae]
MVCFGLYSIVLNASLVCYLLGCRYFVFLNNLPIYLQCAFVAVIIVSTFAGIAKILGGAFKIQGEKHKDDILIPSIPQLINKILNKLED